MIKYFYFLRRGRLELAIRMKHEKQTRKNVALVTCFLDNYGACLQAYALQSSIINLGYACKILAYIEPSGYRIPHRLLSFFKLMIARILSAVSSRFDYIKDSQERKYIFDRFRKKHLRFYCERRNKVKYFQSISDLASTVRQFDSFVCGSDQIWNPTFYGMNNPVYHLRFASNKNRIAYSPSIGLSSLPEEYQETFNRYVHDFSSLSVREDAGAKIVHDVCGLDIPVVMDPTLLVGSDFWKQLAQTKKFKKPFDRYILCYIFSNTPEISSYIQSVRDRVQLPVVFFNVSTLQYQTDLSYCARRADPVDFLNYIRNAEFILTDSFHGTAFSILFEKEFYVIERHRTDESIVMISRISSVLNRAGLQDRLVDLRQAIPFPQTIDYETVNRCLDSWRNESARFLKNALENESENTI